MSNVHSKPKVACNRIPPHVRSFREILKSFTEADYVEWDYSDVLDMIKEYDAIVTHVSVPIDAKTIYRAKNLKVIATPSTGTDHIDIKAALERNIHVISIKDDIEFLDNITSTAELAFGLIICLLRNIPWSFESVKSGKWDSSLFRGHMLSGKSLGIIGAGRLGKMMCKYGNAFRMRVLAYDPYVKINMANVEQVDLDSLLAGSDIVSVHVHLNDETRAMIGKRELSIMKPNAILINTSRGAVIDENALVEALQDGKIAGAAVDVLTDELSGNINKSPLVNYARENRSVIITPHIGGVTYEAQELAYGRTAEKMLEWFKRNW
ncbi:MAG: hypothetical protein GX754_09555 [Clostridiaceae bacterium]|nr:hypothetical protein [Clostridiaceae bacterium]